MARFEIAALLASIGLLACADSGASPDAVLAPCERPAQLIPLEELDFLAHAGGSPQGLIPREIYTNTREAFEASYINGFRAYEFDLLRLADGTVIAAHDGYEASYGLGIPFGDATRADVENLEYNGRYRLLFAEDLIEIMAEHPDIWLILDSKWEHTEVAQTFVDLANDSSILDRIVPHLASAQHVIELEDVYPFPEKMVAIYRWAMSDTEIVTQMRGFDLDNVMMWWDRRWTEATQEVLDDAELNTWVHTPGDIDVIESFLDRGVRLYSDGYIDCDRE